MLLLASPTEPRLSAEGREGVLGARNPVRAFFGIASMARLLLAGYRVATGVYAIEKRVYLLVLGIHPKDGGENLPLLARGKILADVGPLRLPYCPL